MLTRFRATGFKNLVDVDLRFGLFTCLAGPNGVGKSNLFDAIVFLSDLASMPIVKAASRARGTNGRTADFESLFYRGAVGKERTMAFVVDMVVPRIVADDFDRESRPTATLLEYSLTLRLNDAGGDNGKEPISIEREELRARSSADAAQRPAFSASKAVAQRFFFGPGKRTRPFIEMEEPGADEPVIVLSGDRGPGRAPRVPARRSPQTVLSGVNSVSHPTALAARREMQSWRLLQLEPSALRRPDEFRSDSRVSALGEHLPNALHRIRRGPEVANRLIELLPDVRRVDVDSDETRELRTLLVQLRENKPYSASSLSDGTLRFLALSVLASDPESTGVICMEEPENGIHPMRIPEMLRLVRGLTDTDVDETELQDRQALRQVIISTHSPMVVAELRNDELLMAESVRHRGTKFVRFKALEQTWRKPDRGESVTRGEIMSFLNGQRINDSGQAARTVRQFADAGATDLFHQLQGRIDT